MRKVILCLMIAVSAMSFSAAQAKSSKPRMAVPSATMQQCLDALIYKIRWMCGD